MGIVNVSTQVIRSPRLVFTLSAGQHRRWEQGWVAVYFVALKVLLLVGSQNYTADIALEAIILHAPSGDM